MRKPRLPFKQRRRLRDMNISFILPSPVQKSKGKYIRYKALSEGCLLNKEFRKEYYKARKIYRRVNRI